jgi:hypothetical protein
MNEIKLKNSGEIEYFNNGESTIVGFENEKTQSLIERLADEVDSHSLFSDYANEIYLLYYLKRCEWSCQLDGFWENKISTKAKGAQGVLWRSLLKGKGKLPFAPLISDYTRSVFLILLSFILVLIGCLYAPLFIIFRAATTGRAKNISENVCVVRSPATFSKMCMIKERFNITLLSEDIVYKHNSLISLFSMLTVKAGLYKAFFVPYIIIRDYILVIKESNQLLGKECIGDITWYFSKRIIFKAIYEIVFQEITTNKNVIKLYTGNKEDRYAMLENRITKIESKQLTCIPHGLEYAIKFPTNVAGNAFFSTSEEVSAFLNCLYATDKFVYDKEIMKAIFYRDDKTSPTNNQSPKIVYFSESRDLHVNYQIVKTLHNSKYDFLVKLHPQDPKSNYKDIGFVVNFLDDYDEAISNNICIARKSTVLLEALFNNSLSIAYLVNSKDKYYATHVFPSLNIKDINHVFCESKLMEKLASFLEEN